MTSKQPKSLLRAPSLKPQSYYIVKDDFIMNLRRGRPMQSLKTEQPKEPEVDASSLMVSKKHQIFNKMKFYSRSDFYDLDQQIENNKEGLYRKLNVALRKTRLDCTIKLDNPFLVKKDEVKRERLKSEGHRSRNNPEKQLSKLIFNVQPYWVKRSFVKPQPKHV